MTEGLTLNQELENTYNLMQDIRKALNQKDTLSLKQLILSKDKVGSQMQITLTTFKRNLHDILNAAIYSESNGCLEGINRKIKQIERTAYGYRNFHHLVSRIKLEEKDAVIKEKALGYFNVA